MNNITYGKASIGRLERKTPTDQELLKESMALLYSVVNDYDEESECSEIEKKQIEKIKDFLNRK